MSGRERWIVPKHPKVLSQVGEVAPPLTDTQRGCAGPDDVEADTRLSGVRDASPLDHSTNRPSLNTGRLSEPSAFCNQSLTCPVVHRGDESNSEYHHFGIGPASCGSSSSRRSSFSLPPGVEGSLGLEFLELTSILARAVPSEDVEPSAPPLAAVIAADNQPAAVVLIPPARPFYHVFAPWARRPDVFHRCPRFSDDVGIDRTDSPDRDLRSRHVAKVRSVLHLFPWAALLIKFDLRRRMFRYQHEHFPYMAQRDRVYPRPNILQKAYYAIQYYLTFNYVDRQVLAEKVTYRPSPSVRMTLTDHASHWKKQGRMPAAHSHPASAGERTAANDLFNGGMRRLGRVPYAVGAGPRDDGDGMHMAYFDKDHITRMRVDTLTPNHGLTFVDVDYYTDMRHWARYGLPMYVYTQTVNSVAGSHPDGVYCVEVGSYFDPAGKASVKDGTILVNRVNGGASYRHPMWNWNIDHFSVIDFDGNRVTFLVEQRKLPSGRLIIICVPSAVTPWPFWKDTPDSPLRRVDWVKNGHIVHTYNEDGVVRISLGMRGLWSALDTTPADFAGWQAKFRGAKSPCVGDVERYMATSGLPSAEARRFAPLVFDLFQKGVDIGYGCPDMVAPDVTVTSGITRTYVAAMTKSGLPDTDVLQKPIHMDFAPNLCVHAAYAPSDCWENEMAGHDARVKSSQQKFANCTWHHSYRALAKEFVDRVLGDSRGTGVPLTFEELFDDHWTRPTQKAFYPKLDTAFQMDESLRGFLKKDTSVKPRIIGNLPNGQKAPLGCYMHSLIKELKKRHRWVMCGLSPAEVAARVADIAMGVNVPDHLKPLRQGCSEGDMTNCDGCETRDDRDCILEPIFFGFFAPQYRELLRDCLRAEDSGKKMKMACGYIYKVLWELLSGTSRTTLSNILKCAFREFCALCKAGLDYDTAFALIMAHCGDDSIMTRLNIEGLDELRVKVCFETGMEMRLITRFADQCDPVTFLGEYYLNPWANGMIKVPDFWRQAAKVHVTMNRTIPCLQAAANKAAGLLSSCGKYDPVLGPWAEKVMSIAESRGVIPRVETMSRGEVFKYADEVYGVEGDVVMIRAKIYLDWLNIMDVDGAAVDRFRTELAAATSLDELPRGVFDNTKRLKLPQPNTVLADGSLAPISNATKAEKQQQRRDPKGRSPTEEEESSSSENERSSQAASESRGPRERRPSDTRRNPRHGESVSRRGRGGARPGRVQRDGAGVPRAEQRNADNRRHRERTGSVPPVDGGQHDRAARDVVVDERLCGLPGGGRNVDGLRRYHDAAQRPVFVTLRSDEPRLNLGFAPDRGLGFNHQGLARNIGNRSGGYHQVQRPGFSAGVELAQPEHAFAVARRVGAGRGGAVVLGDHVGGPHGDTRNAERVPADLRELHAPDGSAGDDGHGRGAERRGDASGAGDGDRNGSLTGVERDPGPGEAHQCGSQPLALVPADGGGSRFIDVGVYGGIDDGVHDRPGCADVPLAPLRSGVRPDVLRLFGVRRSGRGRDRSGDVYQSDRLGTRVPHRGDAALGLAPDDAPRTAGDDGGNSARRGRVADGAPAPSAELLVGTAPLPRDVERRAGVDDGQGLGGGVSSTDGSRGQRGGTRNGRRRRGSRKQPGRTDALGADDDDKFDFEFYDRSFHDAEGLGDI